MPLYEYACRHCGHKLVEVRRHGEHETKKAECPACLHKEMDTVIEPSFTMIAGKTRGR